MAIVNGVIWEQTITEKSVADGVHPIINRSKEFKADNGIIPAGEIVAIDSNGDIVSYDPASGGSEATPVGVCTYSIDTSKDTIGYVIVHGTVLKNSLTTKGSAAAANDISNLESSTIIWSN